MASYDPRRRAVVNPEYNPFDSMTQQNASYQPPGVGPPDQAPPGSPPSPVDVSPANDLWSRVMDLLKGYGDVSAFQANRSALEPLIGGAQKAWGLDDEGLMSRLAYNPLKGMYTLASYLNGTPFYDKTGDGSQGNLFYVPGFRPPGWGADVPAQAQYDPSKHQYWV